MTIQEQIKDARKAKGLTQQEVADLCGMKRQQLQRIEHKGSANVKSLIAIAEALNTCFVIGYGKKLK